MSVVARDLSHSYGELRSLERIDLAVGDGEVVALVGPSGCGKSTLLEIVCGLREPSAGEIAVEGDTGAAGRLSHCAYMPQQDLLLPWFSALDNASLALRNRGVGKAAARAEAGALFERFGLAGFEGSAPQELLRRHAPAGRLPAHPGRGQAGAGAGRAVRRARRDQPGEMQEWLAGALRAEARTVLLVSHDIEEALYLADRVVVLAARPGRIVAELQAPHPRAEDRDHAVTDPSFVAVREKALVALREGTK